MLISTIKGVLIEKMPRRRLGSSGEAADAFLDSHRNWKPLVLMRLLREWVQNEGRRVIPFSIAAEFILCPGPRVEGEAALCLPPAPPPPHTHLKALQEPRSSIRTDCFRGQGCVTQGLLLLRFPTSLAPLPYLLLICLRLLHLFYIHSLSDHVIHTNGRQVPCLLRTFSRPSWDSD